MRYWFLILMLCSRLSLWMRLDEAGEGQIRGIGLIDGYSFFTWFFLICIGCVLDWRGTNGVIWIGTAWRGVVR